MTKKQKALRLWNRLKARYNNTYLDLSIVEELNKQGVRVY